MLSPASTDSGGNLHQDAPLNSEYPPLSEKRSDGSTGGWHDKMGASG
eukprot:gene53811-49920_t